MPSDKVNACCQAIAVKKLKIAFAESATAGRICAEFSLVEGSGEILRGGISCYEVCVKESILKVPAELIKKYTAESAEVTESLAKNTAGFFKSDITVAVTGLTAPGGSETPEKPVGTMFIHILFPSTMVIHREIFSGTAEEIVLQTVDRVAECILAQLDKDYAEK